MGAAYTPWLSRLTRQASRLLPPASRWQARRLLFAVMRPRWNLPSGLQVRIDSIWDWSVYDEIFLRGAYDVAIQRALDGLAPGAPLHVLDLGCNLGFFTLRLVDRLRHAAVDEARLNAVLVDASAPLLTAAVRRLQQENALRACLTPIHGLVGKRSGTDCLSRQRNHLLASLHRPAAPRGEAVAYVDLEAQTAELSRIDLVKCDIEGAELAFLENYPALLAKTNVVSFELHHDLIDTARCVELLAQYGFVENHETAVEPEKLDLHGVASWALQRCVSLWRLAHRKPECAGCGVFRRGHSSTLFTLFTVCRAVAVSALDAAAGLRQVTGSKAEFSP